MTIHQLYLNEEISIRSYNVCKYNNLNYISDLVKYYHKNRTFIKLRNCGRKSNNELISICIKYDKKHIYKVLDASASAPESNVGLSLNEKYTYLGSKEREELERKDVLAKKISYEFPSLTVSTEIIEKESIFLFMDSLLSQNALLKPTRTYVFKKAFKIYQNQEALTVDEIAEQVDLSRERVRQIRKLLFDDLFNKLPFISNFNDDLFQKYSIDVESMSIEITTDILAKINQSNKTNFSREFITYILSAYLKDSFSIVGNYEDVLQPKYSNARNRHNWNNFYLIEKELASEIDFTFLTNDISNRINDRIEESYSFNFKSYLSKFLTNNKIDILDMLFPICEKIINEEFEIYLDLEDNIIFRKNTQKKVPEYIIEALENFQKPSKLSEIYIWINDKYPGTTKSEKALRGSCKRSSEIIYFGRSSTFGLKKWESTRDNIKGGTIKDIITELLESSQTPLHITEILQEIHKYRPKTNERNVITNLKLDPNNSFKIFNQKFIGLKNKKNGYDLKKYENLPIQLGNTIKGKIKRNLITSKEQLRAFLTENYNLTNNEIKNILTSLNINI